MLIVTILEKKHKKQNSTLASWQGYKFSTVHSRFTPSNDYISIRNLSKTNL